MGRIRYVQLSFVAILLCFIPFAIADAAGLRFIPLSNGVDTLVVPASSPLKFKSFGKDDAINFSGTYVLSGTYYYGYLGMEGEEPGDLTLYIDPEPKILASLPYWKVRSGLKHIYIENDKVFARAVVPPDVLARLQSKKLISISGYISIVVDGYVAWIECDAPNYSTRFVSVYNKKLMALSQAYTGFGCG